jgi:hypothetical protein
MTRAKSGGILLLRKTGKTRERERERERERYSPRRGEEEEEDCLT